MDLVHNESVDDTQAITQRNRDTSGVSSSTSSESAGLDTVPGLVEQPSPPALASILSRADPASDDWDTEVLNQMVSQQLARLSQSVFTRVKNVRNDRTQSVLELVTSDFSTTTLRPTSLQLVYDRPPLSVFRANQRTDASQDTRRFAGPEGLTEALQPLRKLFAAATQAHSKVKVVSLEANAQQAQTKILVRWNARLPHGSTQVNASWICHWQIHDLLGPPKLTEIELLDYEETTCHLKQHTLLSDATHSVLGQDASYRAQLTHGIDHWRDRITAEFSIAIEGHHGLSIGDVNGDQLDDLYVCQATGLPNRLFVQHPDGTAKDFAAAAGVDWLEATRSALFVDLDNDGDQDLVLALLTGMLVQENDGTGRFTDRCWKPTQADQTSLSAVDYNQDGLLDIYACVYRHSVSDYRTARFPSPPTPYHDANNGGGNVLWQNQGNFDFTDVTAQVGLNENNRRFSFAATWEDFDNDGDQDLYVANDFGRNNLYRNDGTAASGTVFVDVARQSGVEDISAGMGVTWSDFDRDGWMDLYVSNMFSSAGNRIAYQRTFKPRAADEVRSLFQRHARGNTLFRNTGRSGSSPFSFVDVSQQHGVTMGRWAWSSQFADLNNDGWDDLLVANGYITGNHPNDL